MGVSLIKKKTVFVVGAGASCELGLPLGEDLLKDIASALDYKIEHFDVSGGSREIWRTVHQLSNTSGRNLNDFFEAAMRVRDAAHLGLSIDNVVHQQYSDEIFVTIAKISIACLLLKAEDRSDLRIHENYKTVSWPNVRGTWLGRFAQLLVQDVSKEEVENIFSNVSVVSFNYDRAIRRFLPYVLISQFALPESKAFEISKKMPIFHPYGSLGNLQWEGGPEPVIFGAPDRADLLNVAKNIRTFTEQVSDHTHLSAMREALSNADRIIFLGFGYLSQNMQLITDGVTGSASTVMGTSFGLSEPDQEIVSAQLRVFFKEPQRTYKDPFLKPLKCEEFIRQNFRSITS